MPHIDTLLPLYPDAAGRSAMLQEALAQVHADLSGMGSAIEAGDYLLARQLTHRAKGTACFLGTADMLRAFDALTDALRARDPVRVGVAYAPVRQGLLELEHILLQRLRAR